MIGATAVPSRRAPRGSFFLLLSLLLLAVVGVGFSYTIGDNLLHPAYPRPAILYVHVVIFSAWVLLFLVQAVLVRADQVRLHRRLGQWGLVHGTAIPLVGVATAIAMTRLRVAHGELDAAPSFVIPCFDMLAFAVMFALAAAWRRRPELHRRCMWVATACLTAAAFGRMPLLDQGEWFYVGVDGLILLGALRDLAVSRRIHRVYWYALPAIVAGQLLTAYVRWSPWWLSLAPTLFR